MTDGARRPLVSGNWKMNNDHLAAIRLVQDIGLRMDAADVANVDVSLHPPFVDLRSVQTVLEDRAIPLTLGAQHCYSEDQGAFTGEISPLMLQALGVTLVIVGHSERRRIFGQTDEEVRAIVGAVFRCAMTPIVCVGEDEDQREANETEQVLTHQVTYAIENVAASQVGQMVIAYEPIWAIGTGKTASAQDAQSGCAHIRSVVRKVAGDAAAGTLRVQYGGSVTPETTPELFAEKDVDGFLVGGASLKATDFVEIFRAVGSAKPPRKSSRTSG